jgi:ribosomal protein S18 acetylase RimI-like enzyme
MDITIRQATTEDALHVAAIIDIAGHGIDLDLWLEQRDEDHSVLSAARRLVLEDTRLPYHYTNACMIEVGGKVAGGMVGGLTVEDDAPAQWIPPYLVPLLALETRLPGFWSVVAVALYREFRGQGLAARLLDHAGKLANEAGARGLSIVVEDTNTPAIALYKQQGFAVHETMPWVAYGDRLGPKEWVMLTRRV